MMDKSEKRFERDIESFLTSPAGGYTQFCGQDAEGNWVHTRQHDIAKCIYMDVLCEFIAKTQQRNGQSTPNITVPVLRTSCTTGWKPPLAIRAFFMFCATASLLTKPIRGKMVKVQSPSAAA